MGEETIGEIPEVPEAPKRPRKILIAILLIVIARACYIEKRLEKLIRLSCSSFKAIFSG